VAGGRLCESFFSVLFCVCFDAVRNLHRWIRIDQNELGPALGMHARFGDDEARLHER